jgi:hypothetical protein
MSDLSGAERRKLEQLFEMEGGYVLNFSNFTFAEFVEEHAGIDIYDNKYMQDDGGSKAKRLRSFWKIEPNHVAGHLVRALMEYRAELAARQKAEASPFLLVKTHADESQLLDECRRIADRLTSGAAVDLDALQATGSEPDFDTVASEVRDTIMRNKPEVGLDRLHTFVVKFVRTLCAAHGIGTEREKALHALFGEYVKALKKEGRLESQMTERILKASISTLEAFNLVRNEQSLAHDNRVLNRDESLLIVNHVASTVRFLRSLEDRIRSPPAAPAPESSDDIPF